MYTSNIGLEITVLVGKGSSAALEGALREQRRAPGEQSRVPGSIVHNIHHLNVLASSRVHGDNNKTLSLHWEL